VEIGIKKVGQRDGKDRFVLVSVATREVLTVRDISEKALRKFFKQRGCDDETVNQSLARARRRYDESASKAKVDDSADTMEDGDLLFELGLEANANVHK